MRLSDIPGSMYNFHPGSHVKQGVEVGIKLISELTQKLVMAGYNTTILLETMAGKGSEVGRNFQEIKEIIDIFAKKINPNVVYAQLQTVIHKIVYEKGLGSELLLFGLKYYIEHSFDLCIYY